MQNRFPKSWIVFNLTGETVDLRQFQITNVDTGLSMNSGNSNDAVYPFASTLIFNMPNADTVNVQSAIFGVLIAPNATVSISSTSSGWIVADTVTNPGGEWHFVYQDLTKPLSVTVAAKKTLDGEAPGENTTFSFKVERWNDGDKKWEEEQIVTNFLGDILFRETFSQAGTYYYRVSEVNGGGAYQYDAAQYIVKIDVTAIQGNILQATQTIYKTGEVAQISDSVETDQILFQNTTGVPGYVLPETGGRGTSLFTAGGAALLALAVPTFAAENEYTITAPDNGHTYEVYQIFTGDYYEGVLSNIKWGQNGTGTTGEAVSSEIISELTGATGSDTEKLAVIEKYVDLESKEFGTVSNGNPLTVPGGYYLIKDVDGSQEGDDDSYTLYIVQVADDVTITPKADVPEFEKKVQDADDTAGTTTGWQDSADHDIGDIINFQLKGTVADNYDAYKVYKFVFHDTESTGLTFQEVTAVKVDGTLIDSGYQVVTEELEDGCTFEVVFENLKSIESVHAGSVITVEYTSKLNENAVIGSTGNPNTANLEFSNNPNDEQGGETGETPDDTVIVFTYKTVIDKVDGEQQPLAGAEFTLEKFVADEEGADTYNEVKGTWTKVGDAVVTEEGTQFTFKGLDDGTYRLTETKTPDGYNTIEPIIFTVTAEHEVESDNPALTSLNGNKVSGEITFTPNQSEGSLTATVVNQSGLELPETGGMGTTIFYVIGGILVAGVGVLLITRRRMNMK